MTGLVVEGGAFRGAYTDGVLDALLDRHIEFQYIIGVSAGISNAYSYASKQHGRNWDILEQYRNDKRYYGVGNFFKYRSIFGLDFAYDQIPNQLIPFDFDEFGRYTGKILAGVTNADTGKIEYFDKDVTDTKFNILRASCALPLFFPVIKLNGGRYYDGGMVDPIPIRKSLEDGNKKHLIILTREQGYQKIAGRSTEWNARLIKRKYPNLESAVRNRHTEYNKTVDLCNQLEVDGTAVVLRPSKDLNVGRFEKDIAKLRRLYEAGYEDTVRKIEQIKELF